MNSRRHFIKSLLSSAGVFATAGAVPGLARAMIAGPVASSGAWSPASDAGILQAAWNARFTNQLPNPLDPKLLGIGFIYRPDIGTRNTYSVSAGQIDWDCLGIGKMTPVWGYGNYEGGEKLPVTFPGRTFVAQRNQPITVNWLNKLHDNAGYPLPSLLPIDQTITMQDVTSGVPIAVHHHGGDTASEFDGNPDQWQTPVRQQVGPGVSDANTPDGDGLTYTYANGQEASMHWYHDHAEGITRINAYAGLAGLYIIRDANEAALIETNSIPSGDKEVALVLQDRCFAANGAMSYAADPAQNPAWVDANGSPAIPADFPADNPSHFPEMFGDVMMVNGVAWPNYDVEAAQYRVRLLNGSDSRVYRLSFGAAPVWAIGTDLGFLNAPVSVTSVIIAPGERKDLVVDFSALAGQVVVVGNDAPTPFPDGDPVVPGSGADVLMRFSVVLKPGAGATPSRGGHEDDRHHRRHNKGYGHPSSRPPVDIAKTRTLRGLAPDTPRLSAKVQVPRHAKVRHILLAEGSDQYGRIMPLLGTYDPTGANNTGTLSFHEPATEHPRLGSTEVWEFWNTTVDAHPIHMHLVQFRVLDRQPFAGTIADKAMDNGWTGVQLLPGATLTAAPVAPTADEAGWKDTVICYPGQVTRVVVTFKRPGKYVYHCHILSHEEHDMMRWFVVS